MSGEWDRSLKEGTGPICAKHPKGRSGKWGLSPFSESYPTRQPSGEAKSWPT
jgi:hypothetical protein